MLPPQLVKYTGHKGKVQALCLTTDDKAVVSVGTDKMVHVWELATGVCLASLLVYVRARVHTRTHIHTRVRTCAHTRTHTHLMR